MRVDSLEDKNDFEGKKSKLKNLKVQNEKICNTCKSNLPSKLDRGICPFCKHKN